MSGNPKFGEEISNCHNNHFILDVNKVASSSKMSDKNFLVPENKLKATLPTKLPSPFSPEGMLQPSHLQSPPMFGPRGSTIPPKHLVHYAHFNINRSQSRQKTNHKSYNPRNAPTPRHGKIYQNDRPRFPQHNQRCRNFWCEACDRDFLSEQLLLEHKSEHQKCGIDGCQFEGHELIVTKHIQMQHSTGLYDRLKNLKTPEDIVKWREERKKRYPTKANIELRQVIQIERNKRGEKLNDSTARFGRKSDRRNGANRPTDNIHREVKKRDKKKKRQRGKKQNDLNTKQRIDNSIAKNVQNRNNQKSLNRFQGTSQLKDYTRKEINSKNVLSGLIGTYGSDSESDLEEVENRNPIVESPSTVSENVVVQHSCKIDESEAEECKSSNNSKQDSIVGNSFKINASQIDIDVDDLPSEEPIVKQKDDEIVIENEISKIVRKKRTRVAKDMRISKRPTIMDLSKKYRNQNTMLEKLLQKDIRHERNVLLQCIRHVVNENFFGMGKLSSTKGPSS